MESSGKIALTMKDVYDGFVRLKEINSTEKVIYAELEHKIGLRAPLDSTIYNQKITEIQRQIEILQKKILDGEKKIESLNKELEDLIQNTPSNKNDIKIKKIRDVADKDMQNLNNELERKIASLREEKTSLLSKLKLEHDGLVAKHEKESSFDNLDEYSKNALIFHKTFIDIEKTASSLKAEEDAKEENASADNLEIVSKLSAEIETVNAKYAPILEDLQSKIDEIYDKYESDIESYRDRINDECDERDDDIFDLRCLSTQLSHKNKLKL